MHHASNPDYIDKNYGGVLIVFDRLFGTYVEERDEEPCRYGLVKPIHSHNPLWIAFHEWVAMAKDVWRARSLRDAFIFMFGPPGWKPDDRRNAMRKDAEVGSGQSERQAA